MDPIDFRLKNAAKEGTKSSYGPTFGPVGLVETLEAAKKHPHYKAPLKANQGRGVACGFWFNFGGQTCVSLNINTDGTCTTPFTPGIVFTFASSKLTSLPPKTGQSLMAAQRIPGSLTSIA